MKIQQCAPGNQEALRKGPRSRLLPLTVALAAAIASPLASARLDPSNSEVFTLASLGQDAQTDASFGYSLAVTRKRILIGAPTCEVQTSDGVVKGGAVFELEFDGDGPPDVRKWTQSSRGVFGKPEEGDRFGHSVVASPTWVPGKFMVGVPREDLGDKVDAGMVNFVGFLGSTSHETIIGWNQDNTAMSYFHQGRFNIKGKVEAGDRLGNAIALGDLNADGGVDLIAGALTEHVGGTKDAGSINVLMYDAQYQLDRFSEQYTHFNNQLFSQRVLMGGRNDNEYFGGSIAVGDFNLDGANDIAVGSYADRVSGKKAGGVNIIYSESIKWTAINEGGPSLPGNELINQKLDGVSGNAEADDLFGFALAAYENILVVGSPGEDLSGKVNSGAVHVFQGKASKNEGLGVGNLTGGLVTTAISGRRAHNEISFTQRTKGVPGASESGDMFGAALAIGDLNDDGVPDIVVAAPGEDLKRGGVDYVDAGMITIFYGARDGDDYVYIHENLSPQAISAPSLPDIPQATTGERFGYSLAIGDVNGDGKNDLVIGTGSNQGGWGDKYANTPKTPGKVAVIYQ